MKNILKISTLVLATMLFASVTNVQGQVISISVTDQHSPGPYGNGNTKYVAQWIIQDVNTLAYYSCTPNTCYWYYPNNSPNTEFTANLNASSTYVLKVQVSRYDFGGATPVTSGTGQSSNFLGSNFPYILFSIPVTLPQ
jgi:hypothetical protein